MTAAGSLLGPLHADQRLLPVGDELPLAVVRDAEHFQLADGQRASGLQDRSDRIEVLTDRGREEVDFVLDGENLGVLGEQGVGGVAWAVWAMALVAPAWK